MQSRGLRLGLFVVVFTLVTMQSAFAQERREPEGGALPPYAKAHEPQGAREPAVPFTTARNGLPNIMVTGYWPPTNEMLRRFSPDPGQNPDGWIGGNWEGRFYNVYSFFPEFPEGLGKGEGDFEVDYQDTSADWWSIVATMNPVAIITFGRADYDMDWELEGGHHMYPLEQWGSDYEDPYKPTPDLPIAGETPGNERWSTLPLQDIVDAVDAAVPSLNVYYTAIDDSNFLCNFIGYHATWYHDTHSDPGEPDYNAAAGHIHVGSQMELEDAVAATEVTLRTLIAYLDTQLPVRGDFDGDRDVDDADSTEFLSCFTGTDGGPVVSGCEPGDFDGDDDIDCDDWEPFKLAWTGPPTYPPFFSTCDLDCNTNSVADEFDIDAGTSEDCNGNGVPDECETGCLTAWDDDINDGVTVLLNPGGGSGDPTEDALVEFTNESGAGGAAVTVSETVDPVHPAAGGYSPLERTLVIQTSLADGQFFMTVAIPFDEVELAGADSLSVDLVWFDRVAGEWELSVLGNARPSPGHEPGKVGERFAQSGTTTPGLNDLSDDLGDYGVFWNTSTLRGFAWANVDHTTDFAVGVPVCSVASPPEEEEPLMPKDRYLSFVPSDPGRQTALRVTFADLPAPFESHEGESRWVGPWMKISESSGDAGSTPPAFTGATLQCAPHYTDWGTVGLLHVYSDAIVPGGVYEVQAIDLPCDSGVEAYYSAPLTTAASRWGDVVGGSNSAPPNNTVDFVDISSVVDKFKNLPGAPKKSRADVAPDIPDRIIDFVDIPAVVDAFKGRPYPYDGPTGCR